MSIYSVPPSNSLYPSSCSRNPLNGRLSVSSSIHSHPLDRDVAQRSHIVRGEILRHIVEKAHQAFLLQCEKQAQEKFSEHGKIDLTYLPGNVRERITDLVKEKSVNK